jgi:hypothetical protein
VGPWGQHLCEIDEFLEVLQMVNGIFPCPSEKHPSWQFMIRSKPYLPDGKSNQFLGGKLGKYDTLKPTGLGKLGFPIRT